MFRLLGFIIGSAVSIGSILFILGEPDFHLSSFESDQARFDAALQKIREKKTQAEAITRSPIEKSPAPAEQATENLIANIETQLAADFGDRPEPSPADSADPATRDDRPALPEEPAAADQVARIQELVGAEQRWQDFWNPFRSEIAARGFVTQLERVTGLDYRIVKIRAGEYQVGFAYQDDSERQVNIQQISAATGLELPET